MKPVDIIVASIREGRRQKERQDREREREDARKKERTASH
jgi:hypothetical protein